MVGGSDLGALSNASLQFDVEQVEHSVGSGPVDAVYPIGLSSKLNFVMKEVTSTAAGSIIATAKANMNSMLPTYLSAVALAPFATGNAMQFNIAKAVLLPGLTISSGKQFMEISVALEAVEQLVTRSQANGLHNTLVAKTNSPKKLQYGPFQVRASGVVNDYWSGNQNAGSNLGAGNSIGMVDNVSIKFDATMLRVREGLPQMTKDVLYTSPRVTVEFDLLEVGSSFGVGLLDAARTGAKNACSVQLITEDQEGTPMSFWLPSCTVKASAGVDANNEFGSSRLSLTAVKQPPPIAVDIVY